MAKNDSSAINCPDSTIGRRCEARFQEWDTWLATFGHQVPAEAGGLVFDHYSLMLHAAVEGHGMAMGWRRTSQRMLDSGVLVAPFGQSVHLPEALSVYRRHGPAPREQVNLLIEWLRSELT